MPAPRRHTTAGCGCVARWPTHFGTPRRGRRTASSWSTATFGWTVGELYRRAGALAATLADRMPAGSVVSFMLPNWHEAAVVYLGATLAGMVVNPILPSLRDHELRFILDDADSRMIFVPGDFRGHDYAAMLGRVTAAMDAPPEVVVVRGDPGAHSAYPDLFDAELARRPPTELDPGCGPDDHVHLGHHRTAQGRSAHA